MKIKVRTRTEYIGTFPPSDSPWLASLEPVLKYNKSVTIEGNDGDVFIYEVDDRSSSPSDAEVVDGLKKICTSLES